MLKRFEVRNYKNFKDSIVVDFSKTGGYKYNLDCVSGNLISKMLIYGRNASGKTNLGKAIMDINYEIFRGLSIFDNSTLNADSNDLYNSYSYNFIFDEDEIIYNYSRNGYGKLVSEELHLNGKKVFECNFENDKFDFENLKAINADTVSIERYMQAGNNPNDETGDLGLPFLRWLISNAAFQKDSVMLKLYSYIEGMSFLSVNGNFILRSGRIYDSFEDEEELMKFEKFLNDMGIECKLVLKKLPDGQYKLYFKHERLVPFLENASSGTLALMNFYLRFIQNIRSRSFIYLDEFDAFYHYEMADNLVKYFKANYPDSQIIMTTHNTNLMTNRLMRPDCLFILSRWGKLTALCDATERELREGHNLEKMYISGEFEKYE